MGFAEAGDCGTEIRLFDPRRDPQDWTEVLRPSECAVFVKDRTTALPLTPNGRPYASAAEVTCVVFGRVDAARQFCEVKVAALPNLRCEIRDRQGLAQRPLMVILSPEVQRQEDAGPIWARRRKSIATVIALLSLPLFWAATRSTVARDVAIFAAINCLVLALRLVYWDVGVKHGERLRAARLEEHRRLEKGGLEKGDA